MMKYFIIIISTIIHVFIFRITCATCTETVFQQEETLLQQRQRQRQQPNQQQRFLAVLNDTNDNNNKNDIHHTISTKATSRNNISNNNTYMPILLSLLAGLSTCLGAAIVFFVERPNNSNTSNTSTGTTTKKRKLGDNEMCFSLSLAASVMITVSIISILPETFTETIEQHNHHHRQWISISSKTFWIRCASFISGCFLFYLLSKCAFPEPDAILGFDSTISTSTTTTSNDDSKTNTTNAANDKKDNDCTNDDLLPKLLLDRQGSIDSITTSNNSNKSSSSSTMTTTTQRKRTPPTNRKTFLHYNNNDIEIQQQQQQTEVDQSIVIPLMPTTSSTAATSTRAAGRKNGSCCSNFSIENTMFTHQSNNSVSNSTSTSIFFSGNDIHNAEEKRAWRVTILLFVSLAVHNFPEGLAVAASSMYDIQLGWTTTIAIALHNIPEGIAIAVPCLAARPNSPWLAFILASISGLAEPFGAIIAMFVLKNNNNDNNEYSMKNSLGFVAGIMITVAILDLYPEAYRRSTIGNRTSLISGTIVGAVIMILTEAIIGS